MPAINRLKKFRVKMGFTQAELAQLAGLSSRNYFSKLENGHQMPSGKTMVRLSEILKASVSDIFLI